MEMESGMSQVFGNGIGVWNRMHVAGVTDSVSTRTYSREGSGLEPPSCGKIGKTGFSWKNCEI